MDVYTSGTQTNYLLKSYSSNELLPNVVVPSLMANIHDE